MVKNEPSDKAKKLIDENLRKVFSEHAEEELPERFRDLLAQLQQDTPQAGKPE